ncbi:MAG: 4-hydroxy-tetrahydrodipicolinate synthase [Deltaproteobacteria bacterium]|nr:4-hydroxy-tetrahydrodipicolinate synthase [Deltaproteobacteria bacterium]
MFEGLIVALPTPFDSQNRVDHGRLREHIEWLIEGGVEGIVPCGTTGEFATLTPPEREEVIKTAVEAAGGRVSVVAGTGSYSTAATVELTQRARDLGVSGAMVVTPYYNKPNQEGMRKHFEEAADVGLPICLYNVPGRTGLNLLPDTVEKLSNHEKIVAIKEASGNLAQCAEILRRAGDRLTLLAGDDSLYFPLICLGAKGVVSVAGNLVPKELQELLKWTLQGQLEKAREIHFQLLPLFDVLFCETSPTPLKYVLCRMKRMYATVRLPLVPLVRASEKKIEAVFKQNGLLNFDETDLSEGATLPRPDVRS